MSASELAEERVSLAYEGPYLRTMLWLLITGLVSVLIIPAAWATAFLYRRILSHVTLSDTTTVAFRGLAGRVWGWFVIVGALTLVPYLIGGVVYNGDPFSMIPTYDPFERASDPAFMSGQSAQSVAFFVAIPFILFAQLVIMRWAIAGIELTNGPELSFAGRYLPLLGWLLFFSVSAITIVGPAWVATAFLRWFARNIEGAGVRFEFHGSGWGLLWRYVAIFIVTVALVGTVLLSPVLLILSLIWYLWGVVWLLKWLISNVVLVRSVPSPGMAAPEM